MIDHELIFHFFNKGCDNENYDYEKIFESYKTFNNHIFFNHLKKLKPNIKLHLFNEFIEVLRYTNFDFLKEVFNQLDQFNVKYSGKRHIFAYFDWVKSNFNLIRNILLSRIQ